MSSVIITTADGHDVLPGERVYNYYDMQPGAIVSMPRDDGWFRFQPDGALGATLLNGERICTMAHARRMGWPNPDPA